jgi:histidyl-tRNA synthetase
VNEIIKAPKGVPDYAQNDGVEFLAIRNLLAEKITNSGYQYIELPVYEDTNLYVRGVGESTDVVSKEMFTFSDRGDRSITLRPEGTAGVMRAVIEHGLDRGQLPVKLWYAGPFFRAERPQAGRYRQLQQIGIEAIGSDDPALDAEVIAIAYKGFKQVGLKGFSLKLTSLGCANCRPPYRKLLQEFLSGLNLDEVTQNRAKINPLRVLDDKRDDIQGQLADAPLQVNHLCVACQKHYDDVRTYLKLQNVEWTEAPRMVRGLDYYTRTTFEFDHPQLGAQSGIGGGGRYDGLMSELGGQNLSGIGFGLGVDRTLLAARAEGLDVGEKSVADVYLIPLGEDAKSFVVSTISSLRDSGVRADMAFGERGLKGAMKAADKLAAKTVIVVGDGEIASGNLSIKRMSDGQIVESSIQDLRNNIKKLIEEK